MRVRKSASGGTGALLFAGFPDGPLPPDAYELYATETDEWVEEAEDSDWTKELLIEGRGRSAYGDFSLKGRVRAWDGLVYLLKEYPVGFSYALSFSRPLAGLRLHSPSGPPFLAPSLSLSDLALAVASPFLLADTLVCYPFPPFVQTAGRGRWLHRLYLQQDSRLVGGWRDTFTALDTNGKLSSLLHSTKNVVTHSRHSSVSGFEGPISMRRQADLFLVNLAPSLALRASRVRPQGHPEPSGPHDEDKGLAQAGKILTPHDDSVTR